MDSLSATDFLMGLQGLNLEFICNQCSSPGFISLSNIVTSNKQSISSSLANLITEAMQTEFANDFAIMLTSAFDLVKTNAHTYCNNQDPISTSDDNLTHVGAIVGAVTITIFIIFVIYFYCFYSYKQKKTKSIRKYN